MENSRENKNDDTFLLTSQIFDFTKSAFTDYYHLLIGAAIAIYVYYVLTDLAYSILIKIIISYVPIVVALVILHSINSPHPVMDYTASIFFPEYSVQSEFIPTNKRGWSFFGSCVLNIDDKNYLFVGGGDNQKDALLMYSTENKKLVDIIDRTNLSDMTNTYCAVSVDLNNNGRNDLIVGRDNGVFLYVNKGELIFDKIQLVEEKDKKPFALSLGDYNNNGLVDLYISYFTKMFNDPSSNGRKNMLLENVSTIDKIQFVDVTEETNAGGSHLNTFTSSFVDLNNDGKVDLVLAHDSGEIEILINKGGKFESEFAYIGKGNWMGLAIADITGNGYQDLFLTNIGIEISNNIKSDQTQSFGNILLANEGDYNFKEKTFDFGISDEDYGNGAIFADTNMDGLMDLLFAENSLLFPENYLFPKPGHYYENVKGKFVRKFYYNNRYFGQTPLYVDINNDSLKDVIWVNVKGPVNVYMNQNKQNNNYIVISLPKTGMFINSKLMLNANGKKYYKENIVGGLGFGSDDNDGNILFGLGKETIVNEIKIYTLNGNIYKLTSPQINHIYNIDDFDDIQ
jgi:enediyne biosynthesis protein E4